jgi:hypothetical protein
MYKLSDIVAKYCACATRQITFALSHHRIRYCTSKCPRATTDSDLLGLRGFQLFAGTTTNARKTP